jgi:hypothetical protein
MRASSAVNAMNPREALARRQEMVEDHDRAYRRSGAILDKAKAEGRRLTAREADAFEEALADMAVTANYIDEFDIALQDSLVAPELREGVAKQERARKQ